ncbi:MAG TPA: FtsX-like permease family protein, partial [Planctomycetota bacterium]|nr:FtsX-like permease family protein [Planctomycetota bacterium]
MRLVLLLAARHLFFRPGRTLLSALGIAMGIATVVAVLTVDHNTLLSQQARRIPDDPGADLLIQPLQFTPESMQSLEAGLRARDFLHGVTAFSTARRTLAALPGAPSGAAAAARATDARAAGGEAGGDPAREIPGVEVMAVEPGASAFHHAYTVADGRDLDATSDAPQLLLSAALAERMALRPGDAVDLFEPPARRGPTTRCVGGKLVVVAPPRRAPTGEPERFTFTVVGVLAPTRLGYVKDRVIIGLAQGSALLGADLDPRFWADLDTAQSDFLGAEAKLREGFTVFQPRRALAGLSPEEAAFRSGVRLCGFLALFLGLYIIFNTMSMSLVERVRQIGLLRALGLTRGRLFLVFLVEGLVLALLGAGLSVAIAERIVHAMVALRITTLGFGQPLEIVEVPWGPVLGVMAAGVLFSLLGIVYPFLRAAGLSVIDALRRGVIALSDDPFTGARRSVLLGLLALVPVAWFVGAPSEGALAEPLWKAFVMSIALVAVALAVPLLLPGLLPGLASALLAPLRGPSIVLARSTIRSARHRVFATVSGLMLVFAAVFVVVSVLEGLKADTRDFAARALAGRLYVKTTPEGAERIDGLRHAVPELLTLSPLNVE